jgi:hydroxypyruvate reductase
MNRPTKHPKWIDHRSHLNQLQNAALSAVDPQQIIQTSVSLKDDTLLVYDTAFPLTPSGKILIIGAGKAGIPMARGFEQVLGNRITDGLVAVPMLVENSSNRIELIVGGHPLPDEGSIEAGNKVRKLLETTHREDLVIVLISGGGSALLEQPEEGVTLSDLQVMNDLLIRNGVPIQEINTVRRQLSRIKGGGLAKMAAPAKTIALILSDVIGDSLNDVASGPTIDDQASAIEALIILDKYHLTEMVPEEIILVLKLNLEQDNHLQKEFLVSVWNFLIGNNKIAADAAKRAALDLGFQTYVVTTIMRGEAREVGRVVATLVKCLRDGAQVASRPICLILGGETTVTVRGNGVGGRNQELALAASIELAGTDNLAMMTLATDGVDGPTSSAGALVTGETLRRARKKGLYAQKFLENNDSHVFFTQLGDTISTGPTGTNVNDLVFGLVY